MEKYFSWSQYFKNNSWDPTALLQPGSPFLSAAERELLAGSLQQFQLGESSDGNGLMRRASDFALSVGSPGLSEAMALFIKEEQRHSIVLGLLMDAEGISRLSEHWVDAWCRAIRNLAGFELMLTILTTAELIAVPYYSALHDATGSSVVRSIASRILKDEAIHLEFQATNFALITRERSDLGRLITLVGHWLALSAASMLVYLLHKRLFDKVHTTPLGFWSMAWTAHRPIFQAIVNAKVNAPNQEGGLALTQQ